MLWLYQKRHITLVLAASVWFLSKFVRYAFPPLFETLQSSYSISNTLMGTIYTGLLAVYALLQFPSGVLSARIGPVIVIVGGAITAALGSLMLAVDLPFVILVVGAVMIGAGTGVHKTVTVKILSEVYPNRTGRVVGIYDTCGAYGGVGASLVVTIILIAPLSFGFILSPISAESWRGVFFFSGLIIAILAVLFGIYVPQQLTASSDLQSQNISTPSIFDYLNQLTKPKFIIFVLITIFFSFSYNGVLAFLPLFLTRVAELRVSTANFLYSIMFAVSFIQIITGDISDRVNRISIMIGTLLVAGLSLVASLVLIKSHVIILATIIGFFAIGSHGFRPVRGIYLLEILPKQIAAGGLGIVRTLLMGSGAVAPIIIGYISDRTNFQVAFTILAISMICALLLSVFLYIVNYEHPNLGLFR